MELELYKLLTYTNNQDDYNRYKFILLRIYIQNII